jgi:uncharacterized protein YjbJ (UPF0337 family)
MNWDQVEGKWDKVKAEVKLNWGKLTDDDMQQLGARRDKIVARLQERYGEKKEAIEQKLDDLIARM